MTRSIDGPTFAKELSSDEGLRPPVIVNGFVRKTSDANVIEFSLGPDTAHGWLKIPVSMIKQATIMGKYDYKNDIYDFVTIELNWPDNAEARVFAALLRDQGTEQQADADHSDMANYVDAFDHAAKRAWEAAKKFKSKFGMGIPGAGPWTVILTPRKTGLGWLNTMDLRRRRGPDIQGIRGRQNGRGNERISNLLGEL